MDYQTLIPVADSIPAPSWVFILLEQLIFLLHIILINAVLGGAFVVLFKRITGKDDEMLFYRNMPVEEEFPVLLALAINMGVPPLLFSQVVFGHLFYTSSVLMAVYWILIIPILIVAYYGIYIHKVKYNKSPWFSKISLITAIILLLYIGFMQVANNAMLEQPESWTAYFGERGGTFLNLGNPAFFPRYFHFIIASVAIGGLFYALVHKYLKRPTEEKATNIREGLRIFAIATTLQAAVGIWYLLAIPQEFVQQFMGGNGWATFCLILGASAGIGALATGFLGKFNATFILTLVTLAAMILTRYQLRMMYLSDNFSLSELKLKPQYGILVLFLVILLAGLAAIYYMVKIGFNKEGRSGVQ